MSEPQGFSTRAIHAGQEPDPPPAPSSRRSTPPRPTSRTGSAAARRATSTPARPTRPGPRSRSAWPRSRAASTASPSPAGWPPRTPCCAPSRSPGSHFVVPERRVRRHLPAVRRVHQRWGVTADPAPLTDLDAVAAAIVPGETRAVWIETPTNPLLNVADIAAIAELAHAAGALVIVDNTFATPYLQQPLALGADVVVHSTTKYCGGHSDVVGGALVVNDDDLAEQLALPPERDRRGRRARSTPGWCCAACRRSRCGWSGTATTPSGSRRSSSTTRGRAQVFYPGLASHPGHDAGRPADAPVRRHGQLPGRRGRGGGPGASARGPRSSPSASPSAGSSP